jgi:hypothetical protein
LYYMYTDRRRAICFDWNSSSSDRCINEVRNSSISHLRMEKSLSTDVVLANTVARPHRTRANERIGLGRSPTPTRMT